MKRIFYYEFNIDTACVELLFSDCSILLFDTIAVENEGAADCISGQSLIILSTITTLHTLICYSTATLNLSLGGHRIQVA